MSPGRTKFSRGRTRLNSLSIKHCFYLRAVNTRKPFQEIIYRRAVSQIFKKRRDRNSRTTKHPRAANTVRFSIDGATFLPVAHYLPLCQQPTRFLRIAKISLASRVPTLNGDIMVEPTTDPLIRHVRVEGVRPEHWLFTNVVVTGLAWSRRSAVFAGPRGLGTHRGPSKPTLESSGALVTWLFAFLRVTTLKELSSFRRLFFDSRLEPARDFLFRSRLCFRFLHCLAQFLSP